MSARPVRAEGVGGAALLDKLAAFVRRYVVVTEAQADALAPWIVHTWAIEAASTTPYLSITSAEKHSGKTRVLEVLGLLCREPMPAANVTEAALFRSLGERPRTLLHDEVDAIFGPKARDREDLRAMLNAGYRRGTPVLRCVGEGSKQRVEQFDVFGAKALAGIGHLPDTLADRSISIRMKRRAPGESVQRLSEKRPPADAARLREDAERWATENHAALDAAEPKLPPELDDRAQDTAEPLLAIADLAGGDWPPRVRSALVELRRGDETSPDESLGVRLLADCRAAFDLDGLDKLSTTDLIERLAADLEAPWGDWRDSKITPRALARLLRPYGIRSRTVRLDERDTPKGFHREQFEDAWSRYLPLLPEPPLSATSATMEETSHSGIGDVADVADKPPLGERGGNDLDDYGLTDPEP